MFGGVLSGAADQERILEMSLLQNGGFIKAWGQDPGRGRGRFSKEISYAKEDL